MKTITFLLASFCSIPAFSQYITDSTAIVNLLMRDYATLENFDFNEHVSNVADDYLLLENGEIWDIQKEKEYYLSNANRKMERKNYFDIQRVRVNGDVAYAVYTLQSEITENGAMKGYRWLESALFKRVNGQWKIEMLHSTRMDLKK